jgi:hypothetical protein
VISLPNNSPKEPIKNNILWLLTKGYRLDIGLFYEILSRFRKMPSAKDKYRGIERALKTLEKEGWPIDKVTDDNKVVWYSPGPEFTKFRIKQLVEYAGRIHVMIKYLEKIDDFYGIDIALRKRYGERVWVPNPSVKRTVARRRIPRKELKEFKNILKDIQVNID